MAGNVAEWVADDYKPYPGNDKYTNIYYTLGYKVEKGGSYDMSAADIRSAYREYFPPDSSDYAIGFRCAADLD